MIRLSLAVIGILLVTAGCASSQQGSGHGEPRSGEPTPLHVYAASSLQPTFTTIAKVFEARHAGVKVQLNFGGSSDLVEQIQQGAPADVFASADRANMEKLGRLAAKPKAFASNTLEIAVPPDNPAHVKALKDLASSTVDVVVCAPQVPCGSAATKVAGDARLKFHTVSEEQNVTDVLNKVITGQAEAGLVYVTDVRAAGDKVVGIAFPEAATAVNVYPIAAVGTSTHAKDARAFAALVLSATGQDVLRRAGFAKP